MIYGSIRDIPDRQLQIMIKLCPEKPGEKVTFIALGKMVTLTYESKQKGLAELQRRKDEKKKGGR